MSYGDWLRGRRGVGAQGCNCNATVVGSISTRRNELLFINISIFSFWHQGINLALSSATQHAMPRKIQRKVRDVQCVVFSTRSLLPTLMCEDSVKLISFIKATKQKLIYKTMSYLFEFFFKLLAQYFHFFSSL